MKCKAEGIERCESGTRCTGIHRERGVQMNAAKKRPTGKVSDWAYGE